MSRIVVAYSGGVATTAAIPSLAERHAAEIVTLTLDLGQGGDLTDVRERALAAGAVRAHVIDVRDEFVRTFLLPALQAAPFAGPHGPLSRALAHALIAKRLVEVARMESATAIAFGGGAVLARSLRDLRPLGTSALIDLSGDAPIGFARTDAPAVPSTSDAKREIDANLWGRSVRLADTDGDLPADLYTSTRAPGECPEDAAYLEIAFERGLPIRANGIEMPILELVESLDIIGGAHGIGRGQATPASGSHRIAYEAPAAVLLYTAHAALESLVLPGDLQDLKQGLAGAYADLVADGRWFSPAREAIDAFVRSVQSHVTGAVRLELLKGTCLIVDRRQGLTREEQPDDVRLAAEPAAIEGLAI